MLGRKKKIIEHYDKVSPYYQSLWGKHIHHGLYKTGKESKEEATDALTQLVLEKAGVHKNAKVLDVGCGVGGTSIYLAQELNCTVTGITISPVQAEMAEQNSAGLKNRPKFLVHDADNIKLKGPFDTILAVEMVSHLTKRKRLFKRSASLLNEGGRICIVDWMRDDGLTPDQKKRYIKPIEDGMFVKLSTPKEYIEMFEKNGLRVRYCEDLSDQVSKTWDVGISLIADPKLWKLAANEGKDFIAFMKAFQAMRNGFSTGAFRYYIFVAEKV